MGAVDALWLKLFSGEVLTAYEQAKVLKPTVRVRTVSGQKSAQFPATFNAVGRYHTVGSEITGQAIKHNEIVITLDDLLISDVFVAQIDELKNHYPLQETVTFPAARFDLHRRHVPVSRPCTRQPG
jgi:hypothetical protein